MNLYRLYRQDSGPNEIRGCVVRATDELGARAIVATNCGNEGPDVWIRPEHSECTILGTSRSLDSRQAPEGIILTDFTH